jgi:hypothetical protein
MAKQRKRVLAAEFKDREMPQKSGGLLRQGESGRFAFLDARRPTAPSTSSAATSASPAADTAPACGGPHPPGAAPTSPSPTASRPSTSAAAAPTEARASAPAGSLLAAEGLRARPRRRDRATTDSHHPRPVAPNTPARAFETTAPDRAWVGDVTAVWTGEG